MTSHPIRYQSTPRGAFTLIEVLVVISLIVLLIAMIQPALNKSKAEARRTICSSNLKQVGGALQSYADWNNDFLPGAHTAGAAPEGSMIWMPRIRQYVDEVEEIFNCPDAPKAYRWEQRFGSGMPARYGYDANEIRIGNGGGKFNYGINDWGINEFTYPHLGLGNHIDRGGAPGWWGEIKAGTVVRPSDMVAIGDSHADGIWDAVIDPNEKPGFTSEWPSDRHDGWCNIVFLDQHAEPIDRDELIVRPGEPGDEDRARRWNRDNRPHADKWFPTVP